MRATDELFPQDKPAHSGCPAVPSWASSDLARLPVLSIRQPWAWAIVTVGKDIENRCWPTKFRGRFLIHAAKGCTKDEYLDAKSFIMGAIAPPYRGKGIIFPGWKLMDRGGIVGVAEIVDCVRESDSPWFVGDWGFALRNVQPLEFLPCKGALGFFHLPNETSSSTGATGNDHE